MEFPGRSSSRLHPLCQLTAQRPQVIWKLAPCTSSFQHFLNCPAGLHQRILQPESWVRQINMPNCQHLPTATLTWAYLSMCIMGQNCCSKQPWLLWNTPRRSRLFEFCIAVFRKPGPLDMGATSNPLLGRGHHPARVDPCPKLRARGHRSPRQPVLRASRKLCAAVCDERIRLCKNDTYTCTYIYTHLMIFHSLARCKICSLHEIYTNVTLYLLAGGFNPSQKYCLTNSRWGSHFYDWKQLNNKCWLIKRYSIPLILE